MSVTIKDVLNLIGGELKDDEDSSKRFRDFIAQEKWGTDQYEEWLQECINQGKGPHDPYNRAFQDLVVTLGRRLGFDVEYGKYAAKPGKTEYDGLWKRKTGETIILEVKTSTWPLGSIAQLGKYVEDFSKREGHEHVYGLYVIGSGDVKPLTEQILGSKYKDTMRIIQYEDVISLLRLREELEPIIGEEQAILKTQNLLFPVESINIGNILKIILEIAEARSTKEEEKEEEGVEEKEEAEELPWTKAELIGYLDECTPYQKALLAALVQTDEEPVPKKKLLYLMNQIAEKSPKIEIEKKINGYGIAGARAGFKMRRKPLKKEDIIDSEWVEEVGDHVYRIKPQYKNTVTEWVKKQGFL